MDNKLEYQVLIMQDSQDNLTSGITDMKSDMTKIDFYMNKIKKILTQMMNQKHNSSPEKKYSPKPQDPTTVVPDRKKALPLNGGNFTELVACGISNMRSSQKNYINSSTRQN